MSLFVKEAQPPPGCGRHKWPDSHGPADNRRLRAGLFPRGAVPLRTSGGREKGSGTSSLSETPLLTARGLGRCCLSGLAGARLASCVPRAASPGIHRCGTGPAAAMAGGLDSLCQAREKSSKRPETGTRRKEKTSHARPLCSPPHPVAPHGLCRTR